MASGKIFDVGLKNSIETRAGALFNGDISENSNTDQSNLLNRNASIYSEQKTGSLSGENGTVLRVTGTDSLFNPFKIFRYSKYGVGKDSYNLGLHKFKYGVPPEQESIYNPQDNPTATAIIEWTNLKADNKEGPLYPYPYQINDFLWCKYYGKIPNNRLITLRRYPIPVEDNLAIHQEKLPLIPIAQAVTWWGGETGNSLDKVFGLTYGFTWKELETRVTDVTGNETKAENLLDAAGITNETMRKALLASLFANPNNPFQATGVDADLQEYDKTAYEDNGVYWNRVLGPVNVVDKTNTRQPGFEFRHDISLDFEYNLRSYGRVNPKVAMLDLISNFLSLTYNSAPFYGGGIRYYRQTGYLAPSFNTDALEKGDYVNGMLDAANAYAAAIGQKASELKKFVDELGTELASSTDITKISTKIVEKLGNTRLANDLVGSKIKPIIQKPLQMRSILDGRAVGEWHIMVGNPTNPIAVIGNLCLKSTTISFSDELGEDDFPLSIKFTVTLEPGRPRAKQDIESMFNLGGGDLGFTALAEPSSSFSAYGDYTSAKLNSFNSAVQESQGAENSSANNLAAYFKGNIARAYGDKFAASGALPDYFNRIVTKD